MRAWRHRSALAKLLRIRLMHCTNITGSELTYYPVQEPGNRVPGCWNRVTRIQLLGLRLGLDTKYLVKYNQKALLVLQNKFCDCNKIIFTKNYFVTVTNIFVSK